MFLFQGKRKAGGKTQEEEELLSPTLPPLMIEPFVCLIFLRISTCSLPIMSSVDISTNFSSIFPSRKNPDGGRKGFTGASVSLLPDSSTNPAPRLNVDPRWGDGMLLFGRISCWGGRVGSAGRATQTQTHTEGGTGTGGGLARVWVLG